MKRLIRPAVVFAWLLLAFTARGAIQYAHYQWEVHKFQESIADLRQRTDFVLFGGSIQASPTTAVVVAVLLTLTWLALTVFVIVRWRKTVSQSGTP